MRPGREPGDVTGLDQQPGGAGRSDPMQAGQRGSSGRKQRRQLFVGGLGALVDALEVADQLGRHLPACPACRIARADLGEQRLGLGRGQALLGAAGDELEQQLVQLTDHPDVVFAQGPAPVSQDPQHHQLLVGDHRAQPRHTGGGQRD